MRRAPRRADARDVRRHARRSQRTRVLAVGLESGEVIVRVADARALGCGGRIRADAVNGVAFSPDGTQLLSTSSETVKDGRGPIVWNVSTGAKVATLVDEGREKAAGKARFGRQYRFCGFTPCGAFAITGLNDGGEGHVCKWACDTWKPHGTARRVTREPLSAMAFDPTGRTVACGNSEGHVLLVDVKTLAIKKTIRGAHMIFVTTMAYSPDGSTVLSGSADAPRAAPSCRESVPGPGVLTAARGTTWRRRRRCWSPRTGVALLHGGEAGGAAANRRDRAGRERRARAGTSSASTCSPVSSTATSSARGGRAAAT